MKANDFRLPHRRLLRWLLPCLCLLLGSPRNAAAELAAPAAAADKPTVHVVLTRGPQRLDVDLPLDGKVSAETATAIARLMRCPTSGRTRRIATGTLALLADVAVRYPGHEIEIVSAVRDEPARTREGIKHSKHWSGHAIDIIVRGAKLSDVRDAMWKNHTNIGVGWYPGAGFIHLDYRPGDHDTAWTQRRPNADNEYHPRWARIARDDEHQAAVWRATMRRLFESSPTLSSLMTSLAEVMGYNVAGIGRGRSNS